METKDNKPNIQVLERLYGVIRSRASSDPCTSYTAALFSEGPERVAQKLGEEAVETLIAGATGDVQKTIRESADLIYHLLVLWAISGISPEMVWGELESREGESGIEEKMSRKAQKSKT